MLIVLCPIKKNWLKFQSGRKSSKLSLVEILEASNKDGQTKAGSKWREQWSEGTQRKTGRCW